MRNFVRKVYDLLTRPFTENFALFLILVLIYCSPYLFANIINHESLKFIIWEFAHDLILAYAMLITLCLLPAKLKSIAEVCLLVILFVNFLIESSCVIALKSVFSSDMVAIIMATNLNESAEFLTTYFSAAVVLIWICGFFLTSLLYKFRNNLNRLSSYFALPLTLLLLSGTIFFFLKGSESFRSKVYDKIEAFVTYESPPDLRQYQKPILLRSTKEKLPNKIVLILGESFSKRHSSLYGYDKETNPLLSAFVEDSSLVVYNNAMSPATHTIECIKSIFTMDSNKDETIKWYEKQTLIALMSALGYKTVWISNQSPSGVYDNVATRFAELCDTMIFNGSSVKGIHKTEYDGDLLSHLNSSDFIKYIDDEKCFIVIHLIGSHCNYRDRYPDEYEVYKEEDYLHLKDSQRSIIASYDNSVLYNDYVVSEVLKYFSNEKALCFYFSDHSLDLFDSDESYYGYALNTPMSQQVSKQVPFFVYRTMDYIRTFPAESEKLYFDRFVEFCTDEISTIIMQSLGIEVVEDYHK